METKTTYEITHNGWSISPELNRDQYYMRKWVSVDDVEKARKELIDKIFVTRPRITLVKGINNKQEYFEADKIYDLINKVLGKGVKEE